MCRAITDVLITLIIFPILHVHIGVEFYLTRGGGGEGGGGELCTYTDTGKLNRGVGNGANYMHLYIYLLKVQCRLA